MNKRILKLFTFVFLIIINLNRVNAISIENYVNKETEYQVIIEDDANLLSREELYLLQEEMIDLTKYGNIVFKTINQNALSTTKYAANYYHEIFGTESGTLFLIDMYNRYIYIFSDGYNYKTITRAKANIITDNVYQYALNEEYFECALNAFEQINTLLKGGKIQEPMRYISNIFISFIIAFFINFSIVLLSTKIKRIKNKEILSNCNIKVDIKNINVYKTGTHKEYSPVSDSSYSGGSSSSRSSSSRSSSSRSSSSRSSSSRSSSSLSSSRRSSGGGGGHRF